MLPTGLQTAINQRVLEHLDGLSAHSDLADALRTALKPLGDVQLYCPDWRQYRYVAASTCGVIFAIAVGMNKIGLRLDQRMKSRALTTGAESLDELGNEWVSFLLFRDDWPRTDLEFWARKAYVAAREYGA
ncbi:MAG TPA: hypothetical protein P5186_23960 [Candidatus Paceibacterota bacterium]|nr:hypothetical protein [Verrucomicrobiota bacterium]HRY51116.1 hypothetical protein [Candidatus Paceibacterota bacterium]HSA00069.1 hypothetical protein [Candidatus Paceibacterota bacterium]